MSRIIRSVPSLRITFPYCRVFPTVLTKPLSAPHPLLRPRPPHLASPAPASPTLSRTMASAAAKRLAGKTILITGASSGIGRSTAREFARTSPNDLRLILAARRVDELEQVAKDIAAEVGDGVKVLPVKLDVSDPAAVRNFVPNLPEEWRDIHVLVNNA